jgi:hypothetical protein
MTNADWSAARELESAKEGLARAKKRALERARQKRVITQRELRKLVEMRENLEDWRARREEIVEQIVGNLEAEYDFARRCMQTALEAGAMVDVGEYTLEDALPRELQMRLAFQRQQAISLRG